MVGALLISAVMAGGPPALQKEVALLRKAAAGADSLVIVQRVIVADEHGKPGKDTDEVRFSLAGAERVEELIGLIAVDETTRGSMHLCGGGPRIRILRGRKVAAEFSFDHESILRPMSENLWDSDVDLMQGSAAAIAAWFKRQGYPAYQDALDAKAREAARLEAFYRVFPRGLERQLRSLLPNDVIGQLRRKMELRKERLDPALDPIAAAIPDVDERARVLCRAFGTPDRGLMTHAAPRVAWYSAAALPDAALAKVVTAAQTGSLELRGAARLLFGPGPENEQRRLAEFGSEVIARAAEQSLADENAWNATWTVWRLRGFSSPVVLGVLEAHATQFQAAHEGICSPRQEPPSPLAAQLALAAGKRLPASLTEEVRSHAWQCKANQATARMALALAAGELPAAADFALVGESVAVVALEPILERPTRETIDFVVDGVFAHAPPAVKRNAATWVERLRGTPATGAADEERLSDLRVWWRSARPTWRPRASGAPTP